MSFSDSKAVSRGLGTPALVFQATLGLLLMMRTWDGFLLSGPQFVLKWEQ